jgi:hypothetical protein
MTIRDKNPVAPPEADRLPQAFDIYARALAGVMMLLGLRQWAVILGIIAGGGGAFETMTVPWQLATMHFAAVDLVASVGLWMRVAWGDVVWIYAAVSEIILHTMFYSIFGFDILIVAFHLLTISGFFLLYVLARRRQQK